MSGYKLKMENGRLAVVCMDCGHANNVCECVERGELRMDIDDEESLQTCASEGTLRAAFACYCEHCGSEFDIELLSHVEEIHVSHNVYAGEWAEDDSITGLE